MPSRLSLSRLRPRLLNSHKGNIAVLPQDKEHNTAQSSSTASTHLEQIQSSHKPPTDVDKATATNPQLSDRAKLARLRHALKMIYDTLDEVDNAILDILDSPHGGHGVEVSSGSSTSSANPLLLSVDLHLADLQSSSRALYKLISKFRPQSTGENGKHSATYPGRTLNLSDDVQILERPAEGDACSQVGSPPDIHIEGTPPFSYHASEVNLLGPVTPKQQPQCCLPTPESSLSSYCTDQVVGDDTSVYSRDFLRDQINSPDPLEVNRYTSSPTANPDVVAPLKIPARGVSSAMQSSTNIMHLQVEREDMRMKSSPFDFEIEYLNRQISETSGIGRRHSTNLDQLSPTTQQVPILRSVKSVELNRAHSSRSFLDADSGTSASGEVNQSGFPKRGNLLLASQGGLESIEEADVAPLDGSPHRLQIRRYNSRHFSTEENTRRLRTMRRGFEPAGGPNADSEPLRVEELMEFLREGNSIRDL
ncbi:hypothetical protein VM1G_07449 [Cytospora mali]|uniref:Uncharacterized protein n=1 Tax=Cytospora mali TaxID=578113 RepID=A0A194W8P8_CYTMA|nr:hypothetical protein VM1G_07449 [Valsa mali]